METLTRELIESHLMSFIETSEDPSTRRWAWSLSDLATEPARTLAPEEGVYRFKTHETARNFAFGWIRANRPDLERAAVHEAREGIRYRASRGGRHE